MRSKIILGGYSSAQQNRGMGSMKQWTGSLISFLNLNDNYNFFICHLFASWHFSICLLKRENNELINHFMIGLKMMNFNIR